MEIKLKGKIIVPIGYKVSIKDNQIIVEKQEGEFKGGDILVFDNSLFVIFSNYHGSKELFDSHFNNKNALNFNWVTKNFRLATEEEKQDFFNELKAKGLRWNPKTKEIEKIRKRVLYGDMYLCINGSGEIIEVRDYEGTIDNIRYNLGNYYLLQEREQAEKDAIELRAIFEKRTKIK